jgi:hypothetical protein
MGVELPASEWEYWVAFGLSIIGVVASWRLGAALPPRRRFALVAIWVVYAFTAFKSGFVRHEPGHANLYFATMLGGLIAYAWTARRQTVAIVGLFGLTALFSSANYDPAREFRPFDRADALVSAFATLSDGSETNAAIGKTKDSLAEYYEVDPAILGAIGTHSVHVVPWDASVVRAHTLKWHPAPVFQDYSAYTAELDDRNADELRDPSGPERILRATPVALEGRNPTWESPAAVRAMLCNFRPIQGAEKWLVMARSEPRCGEPREVGRTEAEWGERMVVPTARPGEAVFGEVDGVGVGGLDKIGAILHRSELRHVLLDGGRTHRLTPDTAQNGLLVRVPREADAPPPFALDQNTTGITFLRNTGDQPDGRISVRWLAMTVR